MGRRKKKVIDTLRGAPVHLFGYWTEDDAELFAFLLEKLSKPLQLSRGAASQPSEPAEPSEPEPEAQTVSQEAPELQAEQAEPESEKWLIVDEKTGEVFEAAEPTEPTLEEVPETFAIGDEIAGLWSAIRETQAAMLYALSLIMDALHTLTIVYPDLRAELPRYVQLLFQHIQSLNRDWFGEEEESEET